MVPFILGVVMGAITSYTDVKTGFIDDIHVFPTLALIEKLRGDYTVEGPLDRIPIPAVEAGILYYAYRGISRGEPLLAVSGLLGFLLGLALGFILYYLGVWASGDAVILAGFSALLPLPPENARWVPPYYGNLPLYPLTLLINSILAVFPFIFAYSLAVIVVKRKFRELREIFISGTRTTVELTLWIIASLTVILLVGEHTGHHIGTVTRWLLLMAGVLVLGLKRKVGDALGLIALVYLLYTSPRESAAILIKMFLILYSFKVFFALVRFMRLEVLMEEVPVEELGEWDILGEVIFERDGEVGRDRSDAFARFKEALLKADPSLMKPDYGRVIASPTAEGLRKEQIEKLKHLVEEGKLENRFLRKKAMPFAPALFLGFLISYLLGDLFWWIQLKMAGL